jgi:integrase
MTPDATLDATVDAFLGHRRAIGRKYDSEEAELTLLRRFAQLRGVIGLGQLDSGLLEDFLASRPRSRPRSFNHLLGVLRVFLDWAVAQELLAVSPLRARPRRGTADRLPYIFDPVQARLLLEAAAALPDTPRIRGRGQTYRAIFALCYGLGLRAGEACGLRLGDVDAGRALLTVRGGKFGKDRLIPYGPRIGRLLAEQVERRKAGPTTATDASPLFSFDGHNPVHPGTASQTFHHLVDTLGLVAPEGVAAPCLHSLRHSFAVGCLLHWYREGLNPAERLHHLSTFMGHVDPVSTAVYLSVTPALLDEANRRFEAFAASAWEPTR